MNDGQLAAVLGLGAITLLAATVNGAIGYGFSSITVPLALLFTTGRVLNPALVLVEVAVNAHALVVNGSSLSAATRRAGPLLVGIVPGIVAGSLVLAAVNADAVKVATYAVLLPIVLAQVGGLRRPLRSERAVAVPFGAGVGLLYSVTTISGPPLAAFLNNQGYVQRDFRASIALVRLAASSLTAVAYGLLGLYTSETLGLLPAVVPAVLVGIPLGAAIVRCVDAEGFRRLAMGFGALVIAFGLARALEQTAVTSAVGAYGVFTALAVAVLAILYRSAVGAVAAEAAAISGTTGGD